MNDHEHARRLAAEAIDFALDPDDRAVLDAHLLACASCRSLAERLADDGLAMAMLPPIEPPSALRSSLLTAVAGGGPDARPRERMPLFRSRTILTLTAATVVVAVVTGTLVWWTGRPSEGGVAIVSSSASPAPPTDAAASTEPSPGGAPTIQPGDAPPAAALTASVDREGVVPLDAGFTLVSLDGTPAAELASRLTVEPPLAMAVEPSQDGRSAHLTPSSPLVPGAVYRFTLVNATGEPVDGWAFQADQPLRIVGTLPGDRQTDVPLRTGIEITFDQDGVANGASHVTIEPAVKGRFEEHGRVLAFVPEGLEPKTVYTVTVRRGLTIPSTGQALAEDVVFSFETRARGAAEPVDVQFDFVPPLLEAPTGSKPVISVEAYNEDGEPIGTVRVEVYRLPDMAKAIDAFQTLVDAPRWARWSTAGVVPTEGLRQVAAFDAMLQEGPTRWFMLPEALPVGWYLIQHPMRVRPAQAVLQVTDVAGYVAITTTRSLVWANDLDSGEPLAAATVKLSGGTSLGRTDRQGLLVFATPPALLADGTRADEPASLPVLTVETSDGRTAFLLGSRSDFDGYGSDGGDGAPEAFWQLLHTDRIRYRATDTINAWGMIRERVTGKVPGRAEIRLVVQRYEGEPPGPPLVAMPVTPGRTGAFTGSLPLAGMADGGYAVELLVDGRVITSTEVTVGPIAKPAYRLELATGRHVYIEGDRIKTTVRASFFEGSPVPGVRLRVGGDEWRQRTATTDRTGTAAVRNTARVEDEAGWAQQSAYASVARAEEGEIAAYSPTFLVFPSTRIIDADAQVVDGQVRVTGQVHVVDVERVEREIDEGASVWDVDPRGRPVAGATVTARFNEQVPIKRQVGTQYDFIAKAVVPVYEYEIDEVDAGRVRVKTDPDGRFVVTIPATSENAYRISASIVDPDGHRARVDAYATPMGGPGPAPEDEAEAYGPILARTIPSAEDTNEYGVGETVDLMMRWSPADDDDDRDRFLFYAARSGLREAIVSATPRFTTTFDETAIPNVEIFGVRFTGSAYIVADSFSATFRTADRALDVDLKVRAERYAPGAQATVDVRTRTASGRPVSATVVLRAVDEKLFEIGAAEEVEPLSELYASFGSGVIATYASHGLPSDRDGGDTAGGDTGGGDDGTRSEFVDSLLFRAVDTDAQGRATVTFRLSDDLTSWHVSAAAFSTALEAGSGATLVPVGLPFFADVVVAPEYLVADRPAIVVNTYGSDLQVGAKVTVTVESSSLGLRSGSLAARAFEPLTVRLPRLTPGLHTLTITATSGRGASALRDRLTRTFLVVESRLTRSRTSSVMLGASADQPDGGQGLTTYLVSDAGRGRYLATLMDLAADQGARLDQALAADLARALLTDELGTEAEGLPASEFARGRYQGGDEGLALLPYASSDVQLSALAALVAPARIDGAALERYLVTIASGAGETRERRVYALVGLAGLQRPVLPEIRALAGRTDLTVRERLMVGLAAAAIGDAATARSIERSLADAYRETQGSAIRLRVGSTTEDMTSATALMALLAAWNGSPDAQALWDYVDSNPAADELHALHAVGFVDRMLDRLPAQPARFAYSIAGARTVIDLGAGDSFELTVDSRQRSTLSFESLRGSTALTAMWLEPARAASFERDPDVRVERTVRPSGRINASDLVRVDLTVSFGKRAAAGCRQVTDLVPSGLRPVGTLASWPYDDDEGTSSGRYQAPYEQTGQRVYFCAEPTKKQRTVHLRYYARVVTPGSYRWEPAVVQLPGVSDRAALTPAHTVSIR